MVLRAGWDNRNWRSFILAKSCEKILHFPHVGETVLSNCPNCRRKTEIYELRRWNTYRCHPLQNSQNNLLPSFVSFFPGTLPKWSHITTIERKHIVWIFVSRRCLTGRKRLGWIPASFPRSAEGESRRGRLNERGLGFNTYIHAMLENLSIILSSVILKTTALVMVTGLSGVQFGL